MYLYVLTYLHAFTIHKIYIKYKLMIVVVVVVVVVVIKKNILKLYPSNILKYSLRILRFAIYDAAQRV